MQAIIAKYHGPTNFKGSRYSAKCEAKSISLPADYALNAEDNHIKVCLRLRELIAQANAKKYGAEAATDPWMRPMVCGQIPSGEYVHVFAESSSIVALANDAADHWRSGNPVHAGSEVAEAILAALAGE